MASRLSVKDSLNILLCHEGINLPDVISLDHKVYTVSDGYCRRQQGESRHWDTISGTCPTLSGWRKSRGKAVENLFRRTLNARGELLERRLMTALEPAPAYWVGCLMKLKRLAHEGKARGDRRFASDPRLRDKTWKLLEAIGITLQDSSNLNKLSNCMNSS